MKAHRWVKETAETVKSRMYLWRSGKRTRQIFGPSVDLHLVVMIIIALFVAGIVLYKLGIFRGDASLGGDGQGMDENTVETEIPSASPDEDTAVKIGARQETAPEDAAPTAASQENEPIAESDDTSMSPACTATIGDVKAEVAWLEKDLADKKAELEAVRSSCRETGVPPVAPSDEEAPTP